MKLRLQLASRLSGKFHRWILSRVVIHVKHIALGDTRAQFPGYNAVLVISIVVAAVSWSYGIYLVWWELPNMERRRSIWNELYYCYRDDVVYTPGAPGKCVPVSQMSVLIQSI
jgi:hypothetical protein